MGAVIGLLLRGLGWLVASSIGQWAIKALFGLGIGLVATKVALPNLKAFIVEKAGGMSATLYQAFGAIGGDVAFTMILSAYAAAVAGNAVVKVLKK